MDKSDNKEELKNQLSNPPEEGDGEGNDDEEKEEEGVVVIDGEKFEEDPENPGEALLDEHEEPIPYKKKEEGAEEGGEEFKMPDKFKDKSPEEIAKSYGELEKMIEKKATARALEIVEEKKKEEEGKPKKPEKPEKPKEEEKVDWSKVDWDKMTPKKFAEAVDKRIEEKAAEKAEEISKRIYSDSSKARDAVKSDIIEAQKDHPLLKTSAEYRELALSLIVAASSSGKEITLKEACTKVDKLVGEKKGAEEISKDQEKKIKAANAEVETEGGAPAGGGKDTEAEKIKKRMLEEGGSAGDLGGL